MGVTPTGGAKPTPPPETKHRVEIGGQSALREQRAMRALLEKNPTKSEAWILKEFAESFPKLSHDDIKGHYDQTIEELESESLKAGTGPNYKAEPKDKIAPKDFVIVNPAEVGKAYISKSGAGPSPSASVAVKLHTKGFGGTGALPSKTQALEKAEIVLGTLKSDGGIDQERFQGYRDSPGTHDSLEARAKLKVGDSEYLMKKIVSGVLYYVDSKTYDAIVKFQAEHPKAAR